MKRKLKQNIALFSMLALLMTPGVVLANDPGQGTGEGNGGSGATEKITITLNPEQLELTVGESATITAIVTNAPTTDVSWTSDNPDIAKVNQSGEVTAISEGTV